MFVTKCKIGDTVLIGNDIIVTVVESPEEFGLMRLAIDAPKEMYIRKLKDDLKERYPRTID